MEIEVVAGDITRLAVDAIVNAANSTLLGGGGVDGAIHAAAGRKLLEECRRLRNTSHRDGLPVGEVVVTSGYDLPARWVVHTVGPNRNRGQTDPALLRACFVGSLRAASAVGARSVAFPAISAGAYGWDVAEVARIAVDAIRSTAADGTAAGLERVVLVPFGAAAVAAFESALGD